mmetsp:Transcript_19782/g.41477  ORF Transcript_19782/g.41477 Transcript_19782/m.41477 type:complete len:227 (+) Transcript_19782:380-1060(+)
MVVVARKEGNPENTLFVRDRLLADRAHLVQHPPDRPEHLERHRHRRLHLALDHGQHVLDPLDQLHRLGFRCAEGLDLEALDGLDGVFDAGDRVGQARAGIEVVLVDEREDLRRLLVRLLLPLRRRQLELPLLEYLIHALVHIRGPERRLQLRRARPVAGLVVLEDVVADKHVILGGLALAELLDHSCNTDCLEMHTALLDAAENRVLLVAATSQLHRVANFGGFVL